MRYYRTRCSCGYDDIFSVNFEATQSRLLIGVSKSIQIGIRGKDIVVLGVEKKAVAKLQEDRTVRKIAILDEHVSMAFAGQF